MHNQAPISTLRAVRPLLAALLAFALIGAACSSGDETTGNVDDQLTTEESASSSTTAADDSGDETEETTTDATAEDDTPDDTATETSEAPADDDSSGDERSAEEDTDDAASPAGTVTITAVSFTESTVTIRNDGTDPLDLDGYFTCNRPQYDSAPFEVVAPGAELVLDVTSLDIRDSGGEFGLYQSNSFDSPDAIVAYIQWGAAGNGRAAVAVEAGLIAEGEFVDNGGADITNS